MCLHLGGWTILLTNIWFDKPACHVIFQWRASMCCCFLRQGMPAATRHALGSRIMSSNAMATCTQVNTCTSSHRWIPQKPHSMHALAAPRFGGWPLAEEPTGEGPGLQLDLHIIWLRLANSLHFTWATVHFVLLWIERLWLYLRQTERLWHSLCCHNPRDCQRVARERWCTEGHASNRTRDWTPTKEEGCGTETWWDQSSSGKDRKWEAAF